MHDSGSLTRWAGLRRFPSLVAVCGLIAACLTGCGPTDPGEWPQWRGPGGLGISPRTDLPATWSPESPNIRWTSEIPGLGNSSPIVSHGRIFLTTAYAEGVPPGEKPGDRPRKRVALAVDLESGEILWRRALFSAPPEKRHPLNSLAAPTPVSDGESVFVYFGSVLARLDFEGEVIWQREIDPDYPEYSRYAAASSPVLTSEAVIVAQDKEWGDVEDPGWLAAFDRQTGDQLWRTEWRHTCCSYATPVVLERPSGEEIVFSHAGEVNGYDARTGEKLWSHRSERTQPVPSPVIVGDLLAVTGGEGIRTTSMLRLHGSGEETRLEVLWESERMVPGTASPLLDDGKLFLVTENGVLSCLDAATGEAHWRRRLPGGNYHASPVAGDGKLYLTNRWGTSTVVALDERFHEIAANQLPEGSIASPAVAGGCLLLRTPSHLYCIEGEPEAGEPEPAA